jgi:putative aminopeptidase FrvX
MDPLQMLRELSDAPGASGFEDEVVKVARKYAPEGSDIREDSLRNLYIRHPSLVSGKKPVVMLDAHLDEVGFMAQAVQPNGLIKIIPLGGWMDYTIPAHKVLVRNAEGTYVPGIVATKPPHFMTEAERAQPMTIDKMSVDVGATSAEEVKKDFHIGVGAPVVPDVRFSFDEQTGVMLGKAFDCRAGCGCVLNVLNSLKGETLDVDVVGALAAQEEVGTRGAKVTAQTVKPDIALVFEGTQADDNFAEPWMIQTGIKRGPMLRHIDALMITHPRFQRYALDMAQRKGIPAQEAVRTGGATNGAPIHLSNLGVPTIVIGIPVRYIHSHYGIAAYCDFENGVRLAAEIIRSLNADVLAGF